MKGYIQQPYNRKDQLVINSNNVISILMGETTEPCLELKNFFGKRIDDHTMIDANAEVFNIEGDSLWLVTDKGRINLTKRLKFSISHPVIKLLYHWPFLYFTTRSQIYKIEIPANYTANKEIKVQVIEIRFNSIHDVLFQNDTLFVASDDGLTLIPPDEFNQFRNNILSPYFTNVQVKEKNLNFEDEKEIILRGNNNLHIDFNAINFSESQILYTYRLEGMEMNWNTGT